MRKFLLLSFILLVIASCGTKKQKKSAKESADESEKIGVLKEPLDTSMLTLRLFKTISVDDLLSQDWNMEDADQRHWNKLFWDTATDKRMYPGLSLFRDFSFTENVRAKIRTGKWDLDKVKREVVLHYKEGETRIYYVRNLSLNAITLVWRMENDSAIIKFSSDNLIHKRVEDDPFYFGNNKWRIKPSTAETSVQIRERLRACVHFYSLFFKDNRVRQSTDISFIGLPVCFEWYNGGISMPVAMELDKRWKDCFYSEDQAYKGYDMLKTFFETHTLKWPSRSVGWVGQTQSVLEQIRDSL